MGFSIIWGNPWNAYCNETILWTNFQHSIRKVNNEAKIGENAKQQHISYNY